MAAWRPERERLTLLDATLVHGDAGAAAALAHLDGAAVLSSRLAHTLRAGYLDELGRGPEAVAERARAERLPPDAVAAGLFEGMDRFRRRDFAAAHRAFEAVLDADPAHFPARLAQAVCALELGRPEEAKVGLTACVAQRPRSAWAYFYRGRCAEKLGDPAGASRDFGHAAELQSRVPNQ